MATSFFDRVKVGVSGNPGTGAITLGAAAQGFRSFAAAGVTDGATVSYVIEDGGAYEFGHGTYTASGTSLARTTIIGSSNGGQPINASASATVFLTLLASDIATFGSGGSSGGGGTGGPTYRYWKLLFQTGPAGNGNNGYTGLSAVNLALSAGGAMPAFTYYGGPPAAQGIFGGNSGTKYEKSGVSDLEVVLDFGKPQAIYEVRSLPIQGYSNEAWNTVVMSGSSDGSTYTPVGTVTFTFPGDYSTQGEQTRRVPGSVEPSTGGSNGGSGGGSTTITATKLRVTCPPGSGFYNYTIAQVDLLDANGAIIPYPAGTTAQASSGPNPGSAIDGDPATFWGANASVTPNGSTVSSLEWLEVDLGALVSGIGGVALTARNESSDAAKQVPSHFTVTFATASGDFTGYACAASTFSAGERRKYMKP